jgi:hypothetical protein
VGGAQFADGGYEFIAAYHRPVQDGGVAGMG